MIYKYKKQIVNNNSIDYFYDKNNFVGYILPDGNIYECRNHNVSNIDTVLHLFLHLLKNCYDAKDQYINDDVDDKLLKLVIYYLRKLSYNEVIELEKFIDGNNLTISDLLVELFGCHLVTRLNKTILTSELDHTCFYNYLLNGFKICTVDKIIYDEDKEKYQFIKGKERNDYLYDEIEKIKDHVSGEELELFYKTR